MNKSKLVQVLATFSKEEIHALHRFAGSPLNPSRPESARLLFAMMPFILKKKPLPDRRRIFTTVFGKAEFDDQRLRLAMSALLQVTEKYMVYQYIEQNEAAYQMVLSNRYRARNLLVSSGKALHKGMEALEKSVWKNADFQFELYKFEEEKYQAALNSPEVESQNLQQLSDQLDAAFISRKLRQSCFLLAHQARYNTPCDFGVMAQLLPFAENYLHLPAISLYYFCYLALTQPAEVHYFSMFKEHLIEHGRHFPPSELGDLYLLAINFCTRRYNEGDIRFLQDQFDLYKAGFEQNYLLSEGMLSRFTYLNAAAIGLLVKEYAWVEALTRNYRDYLDPAYRDSLYAINMARLAYQKKEFGEALLMLQRSEYKEAMLAMAAKTLQIKIYFESGEIDLLDSHLKATAAFIRRKKMMGYHRDNYLNLLQFTRKMVESNPFDREERRQLFDLAQQTRPMAEKEWLLEQLNRRVY